MSLYTLKSYHSLVTNSVDPNQLPPLIGDISSGITLFVVVLNYLFQIKIFQIMKMKQKIIHNTKMTQMSRVFFAFEDLFSLFLFFLFPHVLFFVFCLFLSLLFFISLLSCHSFFCLSRPVV